jgi:ABC-type transport system involved in cytochrome bd biosynthesis fused ATPase/permease subunit
VFILVVTLMPRGVAGVIEDAFRRLRPASPGGKVACRHLARRRRAMSAVPTAANTQLLLAVDGVTVDFDGFKALNGFSMTLDRGALRVLIGPNGAGKSTLCDTIIGRVRPTSGHVYFKGEDITHLPEYQIVQRGICRKFQTPACCPA